LAKGDGEDYESAWGREVYARTRAGEQVSKMEVAKALSGYSLGEQYGASVQRGVQTGDWSQFSASSGAMGTVLFTLGGAAKGGPRAVAAERPVNPGFISQGLANQAAKAALPRGAAETVLQATLTGERQSQPISQGTRAVLDVGSGTRRQGTVNLDVDPDVFPDVLGRAQELRWLFDANSFDEVVIRAPHTDVVKSWEQVCAQVATVVKPGGTVRLQNIARQASWTASDLEYAMCQATRGVVVSRTAGRLKGQYSEILISVGK
jgi:hypothetical protein